MLVDRRNMLGVPSFAWVAMDPLHLMDRTRSRCCSSLDFCPDYLSIPPCHWHPYAPRPRRRTKQKRSSGNVGHRRARASCCCYERGRSRHRTAPGDLSPPRGDGCQRCRATADHSVSPLGSAPVPAGRAIVATALSSCSMRDASFDAPTGLGDPRTQILY